MAYYIIITKEKINYLYLMPKAIPFNYSFYNFIIERIKTIRKSNQSQKQ